MFKPFYDTVDFLYNSVMGNMPDIIKQRDVGSAILLGGFGSYGLVRGIQWLSKNVIDIKFPGFDEKWLPRIEKTCIGLTVSVPILYALIDPEGAKAVIQQHETYTSGMISACAGGITAATQDLHNHKIGPLEDEIDFLKRDADDMYS